MVIVPTEKRFDWQHAPIVLIVVVLLNILVFFLYQTGDDIKIQRAFATYSQANVLQVEWPLYQNFKKANESQADYEEWLEYAENADEMEVILEILFDRAFTEYLAENSRNLISDVKYPAWDTARTPINAEMASVSYQRFGLTPNDITIASLLFHQFLHGDTMHLLGNLFFLIVCGFAVEAAIGHLRFLVFYLVSGVAGGLAHAFISSDLYTPLVGASGAISGVMAMYLGVFRLKKIEFFYWFFIFVGYFRAPALLILPFYIGKELFQYFTDDGARIAFMAHAGGFVAGSILTLGTFLINRNLINEEYVEEDQSANPYQEKLAKVYGAIEKFQFKAALRAADSMIEEFGATFELLLIRYNLLKIDKAEGFQESVIALLEHHSNTDLQRVQQAKLWTENPEQQPALPNDAAMRLALNLANDKQFATAEELFKRLSDQPQPHPQLVLLAKRLAEAAQRLKQGAKQRAYEQYATGAR